MARSCCWMLAVAAACGSEGSADPDAPVDVYPEAPDLPDGALKLDFPETLVPAATELQQCYFMPPLEQDVYVTALDSFQGEGGHHLVLFKSIVPEPPGSVRDCTGISDMITLIPVVSSVNFGLEHFPAGMAVRVKTGTQLVLQQHYVNTTDRALRTHDVAHLQTIARDDVQTFAGFYGLANIEFELPAEAGTARTIEFGCSVPRDANILLVGPHMHEWGTSFRVEAGPPGAAQTLIDIPDWEPWMRDEPPALEYSMQEPFVIHEGDVVRTRCTFDNTSGHALAFPSEMCATYGYYYPAPEGSEEWLCAGGDEAGD